MAGSTLTTAAHIYKIKYSDKQVEEVALREHPTLSMIAREGGFTGITHNYPIDYAFPQGVGGTFATAQGTVTDGAGVTLAMSRKKKYGVITLDGEAMAACENNGAFYDLTTKRTDRILLEVGDRLAFDLFRGGNGIRGRRSTASTNVITLTDANDVRNFKKGMTVGASANADGSTPRSGTTTVAAIDPAGGTVTLTLAASIAAFADSDYLFVAGEPGTCMEGMESLTPLTAPVYLSDSFRGIDRGADVEGLAGVRIDDTSASIVQNLGLMAVRANMRGKKLKKGVLNPLNFWTVSQLLGAKVEYEAGGTAEVGFEYIVVNTPGSTMRIYSDPDCPLNRSRAFDPTAHCVKHLKELPHIIRDGTGQAEMRMASEDSIEVRVRAWSNYKQTDTAAHGVASI